MKKGEFCPPLDSSLVAALVSDIDQNPTEDQINIIRSTLQELAAQAEVQSSELDPPLSTFTDDTCSTPSFYHGESSSSGSDTLQVSSNSPLGFLQAALPHVQTAKLCRALSEADTDEGNLDMWEIIAGILTDESIREMEERGLDGLEDDMEGFSATEDWQTVEKKKKTRTADTAKTQKKSRGKKFTIVDIRQQQHIKPSSSPTSAPQAAPDTWTQISSIATHLATLLPPYTTGFFQPYFHSPEYTTPYYAVQAALLAITRTQTQPQEGQHDAILISLLDIVLPSYEDLDSEARDRLISDTELSVNATNGRGDEALDLVGLLRELDTDFSSGYLAMGVYHQPASTTSSTFASHNSSFSSISASTNPASAPATKTAWSTLPSGPPPIPPPPPSSVGSRSGTNSSKRSGNKPSPYQWQQVPLKKIPRNTPHPLAIHIPAYQRDVNGFKVRGSGNGVGKGGKGDVGELFGAGAESRSGSGSGGDYGYYQRRIADSMRRRNEMLLQASKMWQRGNARSRGGEVALYFAERAREFQEMAKQDKLDAARVMVERKRMASQDRSTVDLHGTTVAEAEQIVKEMLSKLKSQPLKIVTGRGAHSVGQVSVLKPALQRALIEDGWSVSVWDAGLIVRGKTGQV
ncbi:hypothetical protein D9758_008732 [Tetrapyrgos nigripes]|uniref:Smr domain-containing protein n=1 Tax=Tetrapyrgos nigripes TaxID=182062 RepID=A0A8H5D4N1_9AGAR|nr:hypothetical protein D9758_008732 [Tetrapyrgos nigripes]